MGCCASVVKVAQDGGDYEEQDVYMNLSEYDEEAVSCKVQGGEVTYSKADSDGVVAAESGGMLGVKKKLIIAQAYVMHGINGDPNQYTAEALKESPKLSRKETTRVLQWVDDTIQCALYQHIANNPKKSHVTLRGIASSAKFKNRTHILSEGMCGESCGITDGSQTSVPEIALNANVAALPTGQKSQHLTIPTAEETRSAASTARSRAQTLRRNSVSCDSDFSERVGKVSKNDSPLLSPDEKTRSRAFDVRFAFAPNLSSVVNMDGALLALNQHCQSVQAVRESGSQTFLGSTMSSANNSRTEEAHRVGLPSFRSVSDFGTTKLADVRELCLKFNLPEDPTSCRMSAVSAQNVTVDCSIGQLLLKNFGDDVTRQLQMLVDRSDSVASPSSASNRRDGDSIRTNERGEQGSPIFPAAEVREKQSSAKKNGQTAHVLEVPTTMAPAQAQPVGERAPLALFGSPTDSSLSWKERTLTFDALKTFVKYQAFLLKQRRADELEFDRQIHLYPPSLRTLAFGAYPYAASLIRPGLIPPTAPITGASRAALQRNIIALRKSHSNQSGSDSDRDD